MFLDRVPESPAAYAKARAHKGARVRADATRSTCEDCGACCLIQPVEAEQGAEPLTPRKVRSDGKVNAPGETVLDEV